MSLPVDLAAIERRIAALDPSQSAGLPADAPAFALLVGGDGASVPAVAPAPAGARAPAAIDALVTQSAARYGVDPALVRAVIAQESGFDPYATSTTGAQGLMQLMPATAAELGVSDPYDAAQNVDGGTRYLRSLLDRFGGDVRRAVAAYNAGPGAVERYDGVPPYAETRHYVATVLQNYASTRTSFT
jgi:soluble lytic murein transglycosylase-like protein